MKTAMTGFALLALGLVQSSAFASNDPKVRFRFPIANSDRALITPLPIMGMDHDHSHEGGKQECQNYSGAGFPFCYNGHRGTDYSLHGGFATMDLLGSAKVVAAEAGTVIDVQDGNFDRCSVNFVTFEADCWGNPMKANRVIIEHKDGSQTRYYHLKKNSIVVRKGQKVRCGQTLGLVGSSGRSTVPHLHFEVIDLAGNKRDPYGGSKSQKTSFWKKAHMLDGLPSGACRQRRPLPIERCAYETIQDAQICGTEVVESVEACGAQLVECGTELVACGTETVTDAVECGTKVVTNAAKCGVDFITDIGKCLSKGLDIFSGGCNFPKTCEIAQTCEIEVECEVEKKCQVAKSCEVPLSCQVKSCNRRAAPRHFNFLNRR